MLRPSPRGATPRFFPRRTCRRGGFAARRTLARRRLRPTRGAPSASAGRSPTPLRRPVPTQTRPSGNRHGRRQASPLRPEQLGDEARVGATLAVAHPESSTASFPSCEVASHALAASRADPNEAIGKPAWATTSVAPTPRTTRRRGPRRGDPCGRPSRIQHGFVSFVRSGVPRPCGVPCRPKRGHRETGMGDDKRRPYAPNNSATRPA